MPPLSRPYGHSLPRTLVFTNSALHIEFCVLSRRNPTVATAEPVGSLRPRGAPSGSHCPAHRPSPGGARRRCIRSGRTDGGVDCTSGRAAGAGGQLDGRLHGALAHACTRTSGAGTRRSSRSGCATSRRCGRRRSWRRCSARQWGDGRIPHIVFNPSVPLDAYFPSPDFWRSSTARARRGRPAHRADLRHRAAAGARAGGLAGAPRRPGTVPGARLPRPGVPPAGRLAPLSAAPAGPGRRRPGVRRAPLGAGYGQQPLLGRAPRPDHPGPGPLLPARRPRPRGGRGPADGSGLRTVRAAGGGLPGRRLRRRRRRLRRRGPRLQRPAHRLRARARRASRGSWARRDRPARARRAADGGAGRAAVGPGAGDVPLPGRARRAASCRERGVSGLVPLLAARPPARHRRGAACARCAARTSAWAPRTRLVPSYDLLGEAFDPHRYWRGPAWFNTSWLLERGLRRHGERDRADALRAASLDDARHVRVRRVRRPVHRRGLRGAPASAGPPRSRSTCCTTRTPGTPATSRRSREGTGDDGPASSARARRHVRRRRATAGTSAAYAAAAHRTGCSSGTPGT